MAAAVDKSRPRILIADNTSKFMQDELSKKYNVEVDPSLNGDKLEARIRDFDPHVIVVRSTKVQKEHVLASKELELVVRAGAGTNTIDVDFASTKGIFVCNTPGKNAIAVAELAMAHLLNMDRRIADNVADIRNKVWAKSVYSKVSKGLYGRSIAVLGAAGMIGKLVAERALAFGMNVRGYDPFLTPEMAQKLGIIYCKTAEEAVENVEAATVHIPLFDSTKHIINKDIMSRMKDGAYLINTSRGGVVKEEDVYEMIKKKDIRYGCDVYENEPKASDKIFGDEKIIENKNIYGTHHIGASTEQSVESVGMAALNVITDFIDKGNVGNCVNLKKQQEATSKHGLTSKFVKSSEKEEKKEDEAQSGDGAGYEIIINILKECECNDGELKAYLDNFKKQKLNDKRLKYVGNNEDVWQVLIPEFGPRIQFKSILDTKQNK